MDAVAPRASVANEIKKKINDEIKSDNSLKDFKKLHNDDTFVEGLWRTLRITLKILSIKVGWKVLKIPKEMV